jgi:hypothetical protein
MNASKTQTPPIDEARRLPDASATFARRVAVD